MPSLRRTSASPKIRGDGDHLPSSTPHLPPARASRYAPCRTSLACALVPSRRARQAAETFTRNQGRGRMARGLSRLFSPGGLLLGTLFFAAALTPTLLPRNFVTQGVLSGLSLGAGYGIGVFGHWLGRTWSSRTPRAASYGSPSSPRRSAARSSRSSFSGGRRS